MDHTKHARLTASVLGAILLVGGVSSPATAAEDPGVPNKPPSAQTSSRGCELMRIGTQYVRCDNLTGAGVPAASWIPEQ